MLGLKDLSFNPFLLPDINPKLKVRTDYVFSAEVFGEDFVDVVRDESALNGAVDGQDGCETARADAAGRLKRDASVGGGGAGLDVQLLLNALPDLT